MSRTSGIDDPLHLGDGIGAGLTATRGPVLDGVDVVADRPREPHLGRGEGPIAGFAQMLETGGDKWMHGLRDRCRVVHSSPQSVCECGRAA